MDVFVANLPIPQASVQQFCGLASYAGEVAANLFFKGGKGITLQVGHYTQNPETHQEDWLPGIDVGRNELILRAVCDIDPSGPSLDVNPFLVPLWSPHNAKGEATVIADALGDKVAGLDAFSPLEDHAAVAISSTARMFMLTKCAGSIFAIHVTRGFFTVPLQFLRGNVYKDKMVVMEKTIEMREVDEIKRDEKGNPIYQQVMDANGKPVREPVLHPKYKRPLLTPEGDMRTQIKLVPVTEKAMRPFEKLAQVTRETDVVALYLQTELQQGGLDPKLFDDISDAACVFDPTWMLGDVLAGKCKNMHPYRPGGTP